VCVGGGFGGRGAARPPPTPNPQNPNPQSPIPKIKILILFILFIKKVLYLKIIFKLF